MDACIAFKEVKHAIFAEKLVHSATSLLPVLFTMIALVIALWITKVNLTHEQQAIADNTHALVRYKDTIAQIDDTIYPLRISAVYAIYDAERRNNFIAELREV